MNPNMPALPAGATLLEKKAPPPEPIVTEEITCVQHAPGITTNVNNGVLEVFLNFDVPTGMGALKRYRFPFNPDNLPGYLDFVAEQLSLLRAGLEAAAEAAA